MNSILGPVDRAGASGVSPSGRSTRKTAAAPGFSDAVAKAGENALTAEAYMQHLKSKYGQVTLESIGKDQESLERAGRRMSGQDVVIAPGIFEEMAKDPQQAAYYERKIDYFFDTVIPQGNALCAAQGLVFEPCGVVVHEDGTVTYICGCSDPPERVAEVNRINRERDEKRAEKQKAYQEQAAAMAEQRRAMWESIMQERALGRAAFPLGGPPLLRIPPAAAPEASLPAGAEMFFFSLSGKDAR